MVGLNVTVAVNIPCLDEYGLSPRNGTAVSQVAVLQFK
ncbi:hypothetical protein [Neisseria meningitidis serogroup B]|uniref:Uncharacterized protein n=1 Tax=Neisseria meningitidis serogroup B TaxID=491 RepID=A0A0H5QEX2_NEIMI|nr:hypothetical protein [Neisseria meningitidis serogroup B]